MTLPATASKVIFAGDGTSTAFAFSIPLPASSNGSDVQLYVVDNLGNVTPLTGNYTVVPNGTPATGGTANYPTVGGVSPLQSGVNALPVGWQLVVNRVEPLAQLLTIITQGVFDGPSVTTAFDLLTMIAQQLQEQLNRAVLLPINTPESNTSPVVSPSAGVLIQYNNTFANLQLIAAANPTVQFWGYATDRQILYFYTGNITLGSGGFIASSS